MGTVANDGSINRAKRYGTENSYELLSKPSTYMKGDDCSVGVL